MQKAMDVQRDVNHYERLKVLFLSGVFFSIIASYTIIKELKDSLFINIVGGKEYVPYAKLFMIIGLINYSISLRRGSKNRTIYIAMRRKLFFNLIHSILYLFDNKFKMLVVDKVRPFIVFFLCVAQATWKSRSMLKNKKQSLPIDTPPRFFEKATKANLPIKAWTLFAH